MEYREEFEAARKGGTFGAIDHGMFRRRRAEEVEWKERHKGTAPGRRKQKTKFPRLSNAVVVQAEDYDPEKDQALQYAQAVTSGRVLAGPLVRAACARHLSDRDDAAKAEAHMWYDVGAAEHFSLFTERWLRHYMGQYDGEPLILESFQEFICGNIFGWRMWRDGYPTDDPTVWPRRFRRVYLEIGKGNGKTPLMAAIALYGLIADREPGAEIYIGASKREQASICFNDAVNMARGSPIIERLSTRGAHRPFRIDHTPSRSFASMLSRDSGKSHSGIRPHFVMLDEIHEHRDNKIIDMMQRGFKWRRQPLVVMATNSGDSKQNVAWEEHEAAEAVLYGKVEAPETFAYVCGHDVGEEPLLDESCWIKSNPLIGPANLTESLRYAVRDAKSYPQRQANVLRLHFCQWAADPGRWVSEEVWRGAETKKMTDPIAWVGGGGAWPVIASLDLSKTNDLSSLAYVGEVPPSVDDVGASYRVFVRSYAPEAGIEEKIRKDRLPYDLWARKHPAAFKLIPGPVVDYSVLAYDLIEDREQLDLVALVYDTWNFSDFQRNLRLAGWKDDIMQVEHAQGFISRKSSPLRMPDSIGASERFLKTGRLAIHPSPSLRAAVLGAEMTISPQGLLKWDKKTSKSRIDALVAMTQALGAWSAGLDAITPAEADPYKGASRKSRVMRGYYAQYADSLIEEQATP